MLVWSFCHVFFAFTTLTVGFNVFIFPRDGALNLPGNGKRPFSRRVEITQFINEEILPADAGNPLDAWQMHLEHVDALIPVQLAVLGLQTFYTRLRIFAAPRVGSVYPFRSLIVPLGGLELEFLNRRPGPMSYDVIYAFLVKMEDLVSKGLAGTYAGELVNVATQGSIWVRFRLKARSEL